MKTFPKIEKYANKQSGGTTEVLKEYLRYEL